MGMDRRMTAAEGVTAAFRGDEVDYTPCVPLFWTGHPRNHAFIWKGFYTQSCTAHKSALALGKCAGYGGRV